MDDLNARNKCLTAKLLKKGSIKVFVSGIVLGKSITRFTIFSVCIMSICKLSYFPFWFSERDSGFDCSSGLSKNANVLLSNII